MLTGGVGGDREIFLMLADAYDVDIMTEALVVDTQRVCQFALFGRVGVGWGEGTPGKLSATYANLMTGVMVVTTICGSLSAVFTGGGEGL